ncbi:hypothetical protein LVD15_07820 [Fulvivirga maritima]|uniref:hypothetical protein n=1 Tax=Fulvivirga maritima TaxID=2904247 RepID=UPI001F1984F9|nr:hypothetical protein [Fulvivirga maritima]UII28325.1 hypothetical protein LVD15_07820 [Fulvivirga maritima]
MMSENNVIERIELTLHKDQNTQKTYVLRQCDISFSMGYAMDEESNPLIDAHMSGSTNAMPDNLFLNWVANSAGEWFGEVKVYYENQENPQVSLSFNKSTINSYSQSFAEGSAFGQEGYFAVNLKGVTINEVKMS